jgi:hypothetical protein
MELYLVTMSGLEESSGQFQTVVATARDMTASMGDRQMKVDRVTIVKKAPGNPYPDRISVGRARNCDVAIRHPSVSKLHAHFRKSEHGLELEDLDSANGTRVNGVGLGAHQPEPVRAGDTIQFGRITCKLVDAAGLKALGVDP